MKRIIYLILSAIILGACTEKMNVDLDTSYTRLSVEAKVTSDFKKHYVKLSESNDVFFNHEAALVSKAQISISDGITEFTFEEVRPGYYESVQEFAGQPGNSYSLSISNVDIDQDGNTEDYHANSEMPLPYQVDSVNMYFNPKFEDYEGNESESWLVSLFLKDDINRKDYYGFACKVNDVLVKDTITELLVAKDTYFNGEYSRGVEVCYFDQAKPDEIIKDNDLVTLETYAITEDYYEFVAELKTMDFYQSPLFSGTPANIRTNISNGAIGYFAVYSITRTNYTVDVNK